jgi:long-subunit acyl-CoA synthetase (AMP-forming)
MFMSLHIKLSCLGIAARDDGSEATIVENGWLRTGNRFKVDKDGNFF